MKSKFYSALFITMLAASSFGQDNCSQILKYGIFDLTSIRSEEDFSSQYINWLQSSQYTSTSNAQEGGVEIGWEGFGGGGNYGTESTTANKNEFSHKIQNDVSSKQKFQGDFKAANANIINAWSTCAVNKTGLIVSAIRIPGSDIVKLKIQVKQRSDRDRLDTLRIVELVASSFLTCNETLENKRLSVTNINEFFFEMDTAKQYSGIHFKIVTNFSDYSATIELSPLKRVSIIKVTSENLIELTRKCADARNKNISRAISEYFSEKAMTYKLNFPTAPFPCYDDMAGSYRAILDMAKQYDAEVARNGENSEMAQQYKGVVAGLASQMEALINGRRLAGAPCGL